MDRLSVSYIVLQIFGVALFSHDWISASLMEVTVRPGENITLYCDCTLSPGVYAVWYRNCSHENQPPLVLKRKYNAWKETSSVYGVLQPLPRFHLVKNESSESYDLLIVNITGSDEGLYYCGTEQVKVLAEKKISTAHVHRYGNMTTRVLLDSGVSSPHRVEPGVSWMMVFSPAITVLSTFLCLTLVYLCSQNGDKQAEMTERRPDMEEETSVNQDEDACLTRVVFLVADGQKKYTSFV